MRDTELYRHLLGLETPWKVGRVELSATDGRVDVWGHTGGWSRRCGGPADRCCGRTLLAHNQPPCRGSAVPAHAAAADAR